MEELRYRNAPLTVLDGTGLPEGQVEMIVSVYGNVDSYGERILYGFFDDSIEAFKQGHSIPGLYMHDRYLPVAKTIDIRNLSPHDPKLPEKSRMNGGLYVKGEYNLDTQLGRETYSNIRKGILTEYSVGITIAEERTGQDGITELVKGKLWEWSSVLWGANDLTSTLSLGFKDHLRAHSDSTRGLVGHLKAHSDMKVKAGKRFSAETKAMLYTHLDLLDEAISTLSGSASDIRDVINQAEPESDKSRMDMIALRARAAMLHINQQGHAS